MSWEVVFAVICVASMSGALIDYALHRTYTPELKNKLIAPFVYFDEIKTLALIHADTRKVLNLLDKLFGNTVLSLRLLVLSLISGLIGYLSFLAVRDHLWLDDLHYLPDYDPFFDNRAATTAVSILFFFNILIDQVSLKTSRLILSRLKKSVSSLCFGLSLNILLSIFLGFMPIYLAYFTLAAGFEHEPFKTAVVSAGNYTKENLTAPIDFYLFPVKTYYAVSKDFNQHYIPWFMFSIIFIPVTASLSSIFCALLIVRDLSIKILIKPLSFLLASLIDSFEREERPILKLSIFIGSIPLFTKALIQICAHCK